MRIIRLVLLLSLMLLYSRTIAQTEIKPINKPFLESIDWFLKSTEKSLDSISNEIGIKGFVCIKFYNKANELFLLSSSNDRSHTIVHYDKVQCEYEISFEISSNFFELFPPGYFFLYKDRLIVIYTGFEKLFITDKQSEGFRRKVAKYLPKGNFDPGLRKYLIQINELESEDFKVISVSR